MVPPAKKRREPLVKPIQRNHATRLGNDEFLDVFCFLSRGELEKLQITRRRFRVLIDHKMDSICLRLLAEVSMLRSNGFRGASSSLGFVVDISPIGTEKFVGLLDVAETEVTKRLPSFFRNSVIDKFDLKSETSSLLGAGLIAGLSSVFEKTRIIGDASFKDLCFGASSSLRSLMDCFAEFSPTSLSMVNCEESRVADADLLFLRDHGTQSVKVVSYKFDVRSGDTISPEGLIQFCFPGEGTRRWSSGTYSLKSSFIRDLIQACRNCPRDNPMHIQFFAGAELKLEVSEFAEYKKGDQLRFPNEHFLFKLPVASNNYRLEFIAGVNLY